MKANLHLNKGTKFYINQLNFRIPINIRKDMHIRIVRDGYNLNGKSKWANDAIRELYDDDNWVDKVLSWEYEIDENAVIDSIIIFPDVSKKISGMSHHLVFQGLMQNPPVIVDGYKSAIIRTAVTRKLYASVPELHVKPDSKAKKGKLFKTEWELFQEYKNKYYKRNGLI